MILLCVASIQAGVTQSGASAASSLAQNYFDRYDKTSPPTLKEQDIQAGVTQSGASAASSLAENYFTRYRSAPPPTLTVREKEAGITQSGASAALSRASAEATRARMLAEAALRDSIPTRRHLIEKQAFGLPVLRLERNPIYRIRDPKWRDDAIIQTLGIADKITLSPSPERQKIWLNLLELWDLEEQNKQNFPGLFSSNIANMLPLFMISAEQKRARIGFKNFNNGRRVLSSYISNSDMDQFSKFTGGLDKSYKINFIFIQSQLAAQKLARNRNIYFSEPFVAANGTTLGMQTLWRQYINANKIFTKDGKLNPARQSWSKYFASRPRKSLKEENPDMPNIRTSETGDLKIILRVKK